MEDGINTASKLFFDADVILDADMERILLKRSNSLLLANNWPIGIGSGLLNYQQKILPFSDSLGVRAAKAHNFYISYSVEFGFLIVPIFAGMAIKVFRGIFSFDYQSILISSFLLSCMVGLIFNEYFISPTIFLALFL